MAPPRLQPRRSAVLVGLHVVLLSLGPLSGCGSDAPAKPKADLCSGALAEKFATLVGGTADDVAFSLVQAPDDGFVLAGRSDSLATGANRGWAAKVDKYGRFIWGTDLGPTAGFGAADVTSATGGGYLVAHGAMAVMKLDEAGAVQWQRTHADTSKLPRIAYAIARSATGGGVIAGAAYTAAGGTTAAREALLVRFGDKGEQVWSQTYKRDALTQPEDVATVDKGFLLVGWTEGKIGATGRDFWALRTGDTGNELWNKRWGGSFDDEAKAVAIAPDGGFVLTGLTHSIGAGGADLWVMKVDANGGQLWSRSYGGEEADEGHGITRVGDNFVMTGRRNSLGVGPGGLWLLEISGSGDLVWQATYGAAWKTQGFAVIALHDGYAVAGSSIRNSMGGNDFWLVRSDKIGQHKCPGALCFGADDLSCGAALRCDTATDPATCATIAK